MQVRSDTGPDEYDVKKRQISVLARDGHLPYQGKRYMGERRDKADDYMSQDWISRTDNTNNGGPVMFLNPDKRYVGALAKSGDLRFAKQLQDKRDEVDTLIDELLTTEELRRLRLEALRDELLKEKLEAVEDEATDVEKKSLASLARSGNLPFRSESKKSVSSLARAGLLRSPSAFRDYDVDAFGKRGIASLARNGQLPAFGKRGGISSIMRNRMSQHKRSVDDGNTDDDVDDIDNLINEIYESDGKRNIASLARTSNLPYYGKRNIASFVRSGGLSGLSAASKKSMFDDWVDNGDDKRSIPAFFRSQLAPEEGKRYLGAFVASNRLPYSKQFSPADLENKRNIGAMARNWNLPNSYRFGKRDDGENDFTDADEFDTSKRYVAALLRQGPIPVRIDTNLHMEPRNFNVNVDNGDAEDEESKSVMINNEHEDDKRHLGSIAAQKSYSAMRKKKSVTAEDQITSSENKTNSFAHVNHRDKRQAVDFATPSEEYPMPVLQNAEITDYDDTGSRMNNDQPSTRNKRYFGK